MAQKLEHKSKMSPKACLPPGGALVPVIPPSLVYDACLILLSSTHGAGFFACEFLKSLKTGLYTTQ